MINRFKSREYHPPEKLGWRDYWEICFSVLVLFLGIWILWQMAKVHFPLMGIFTGLAFLCLGIYRIYFIIRYFRRRQK